jgi:sterol desaturase/sphingolipid hydroxylase (fatty acid hydroxylase superfamily)
VHGFFQHANIDLRLGPLNYFFSMAELHRWHHSRDIREANQNYGSNCIVWDLVFGTFYWPRDRRPPADVGLSELPDFPQRLGRQLLSPFLWPTGRRK